MEAPRVDSSALATAAVLVLVAHAGLARTSGRSDAGPQLDGGPSAVDGGRTLSRAEALSLTRDLGQAAAAAPSVGSLVRTDGGAARGTSTAAAQPRPGAGRTGGAAGAGPAVREPVATPDGGVRATDGSRSFDAGSSLEARLREVEARNASQSSRLEQLETEASARQRTVAEQRQRDAEAQAAAAQRQEVVQGARSNLSAALDTLTAGSPDVGQLARAEQTLRQAAQNAAAFGSPDAAATAEAANLVARARAAIAQRNYAEAQGLLYNAARQITPGGPSPSYTP